MILNSIKIIAGSKKILRFIAKNWKGILIVLLLIFIAILLKKFDDNVTELKSEKEQRLFESDNYKSNLIHWVDSYNQLHVKARNLYVQKLSASKSVDSIAKLLKIKVKNIEGISKTDLAVDLNVKPKVEIKYVKVPCEENDSLEIVEKYDIHWSDDYMSVSGTIGGGDDSIHVSGIDTLSRVDYTKRSWFLGKKKHYVDFNNKNPHIKVTGYKGIEVAGKEKKWGIGLSVQYGYQLNNIQFNKPTVSVGISLQRILIKF